MVYKNHHKTTATSVSTTASNNKPAISTSTKTTTKTTSNPYSGWKTYCGTGTSGCFEYPANWTETAQTVSQNSTYTDTIVKNPGDTVQVEYMSPDDATAAAGPESYYTYSINPLSSSTAPALSIVGGYYTNNWSGFWLMDNSLVQSDSLQVGQTSASLSSDLVYTDKNSSSQTKLWASQENAWFSSSDAQTALLILKSFYFH